MARQYTGSAGKITSCQIGVFAAYVSGHGHALIDRALYLPKKWTDDPDRLEAAYVPADAGFATKPKLATRMIARAITAAVPFKWVAGDTVYGVGDIEQQLRRAGKGYVLGVSSAHVFRSWGKRPPVAGTAADIARTRRPSDWKRLSAGAGTKGPRLHDWCYLELADLIEAAEATTSANDLITLFVAFDYGGRDEIICAFKRMMKDGVKPEEIDEELVNSYLFTTGIPDPDLIVRTSGEMRTSNFLIWQAAYAEWYVTPTLWPDFNREEFYKALVSYSARDRRFGRLSESCDKG